MLASESVTTAIDEAERQNRQQAVVMASVAVVVSLIAIFILLQFISGGDDSVAITDSAANPAANAAAEAAESDELATSPDQGMAFEDSDPAADATNQSNDTQPDTGTPVTAASTDPATIDVSGYDAPDNPVGDQAMTLRGMGDIALGMTVSQAETAIGGTIIVPPANDTACAQTRIGGDLQSPVLMIIGTGDFASRKIMRIDMVSGNTTRSGIGLGSLSTEVVEAYGERIEGDPEAGQLTYVPADDADADYRIILDVVGDVVLDARNGVLPYATWDGCNS